MTQKNTIKTVDEIFADYHNLYCVNCGRKSFIVQYDNLKQQLLDYFLELVGEDLKESRYVLNMHPSIRNKMSNITKANLYRLGVNDTKAQLRTKFKELLKREGE